MSWMCYNKHLHGLYHDICDLNGFDSWYFNMDSILVTHIVSDNLRDNTRWIPSKRLLWFAIFVGCLTYAGQQLIATFKGNYGLISFDKGIFENRFIIHIQ